MALLPYVAFLLWFFLFATNSALTYLSLRTWIRYATDGAGSRLWRQNHWAHAQRSIGFVCLTVAALVGAVSDTGQGVRSFDLVSLTRILGVFLLLLSTPQRLRRQNLVGFAFILLLLGESLILLESDFIHAGAANTQIAMLLVPLATVFLDIGVGLLWHRYTRTVMRVRLTDKFTLAFAVFSIFLLLIVTLSIVAVIQSNLLDTYGLSQHDQAMALQSLNNPLILLFVCIVTASAIISFFLARSLIAPVNRMSAALRAIGKGEWDRRLRGIRSRDEIEDLAHEINEMAQRLKEADALRAEFVSFASHELKNPLTAVKGFIETLQMIDGTEGNSVSPEERQEIYKIIQGECERLLRMTNELLDTSRVEAGRPVVLNVQNFDVRRLTDKVVKIMSAHTKKHELTVVGPKLPTLIEADPDKLEQVLINLLSNAIKYSPQGGPIEVGIRSNTNTIEISVRDYGMGMTSAHAERVFDKFYRIQDGTKNTDRAAQVVGTGIGLYLTRALVNAHSGTIRVESTPGTGSVFTVTLPKKQSLVTSSAVSDTPDLLTEPATLS